MRGEERPPFWRANARLLRMVCVPESDHVWRVKVNCDSVSCSYIGFRTIDSATSVIYPDLEAAPDWVKDRVAVLRMLPPNPTDSMVFGVGRRIDDDIFWVVQPMETVGVDDPRSESEEACGGPA